MRYVSSTKALAISAILSTLVGCTADMRFDDGSRPANLLENPSCARISEIPATLYCDYVNLLSSDPKASGSGTSANPYEICTPKQLNAIGSDSTLFSSHFKLMADIDMKCVAANHTPIGSAAAPFTGEFDGNSKTIRNWTYIDATQDRVGLFGQASGAVHHLTLHGTVTGHDYVGLAVGVSDAAHIFRVTTAGTITGRVYVGGVAGRTELGAINQCRSSADVFGGNDVGGIIGSGGTPLVVSSSFTGRVLASGTNSGGVAGYLGFGYLINSYSTGTITSTGPNVGGVTGSGGAYVYNSYSTGAVSGKTGVGGLVGNSTATVLNSFTTSLVSGVGGSMTNVGFLRAVAGGSTANSYYWTGSSCDADSNTTGTQDCGTVASGSLASAATFQDRSNEPLASWDFQGENAIGTSDVWATQALGYPVAWYENPASIGIPFFDGSGTADDPYEIATTAQFNLIASNPRWMDKHFKLTANLDFTGVTPKQIGSWISPFYGTLDGNSKTIRNYVWSNTTEPFGGMIGVALQPGAIHDLNVVDSTVSGSIFTGMLVGATTVDIDRVLVAGTVSGGYHSGGMIGMAKAPGSITDATASTMFSLTGLFNGAGGGLVGNSGTVIRRSIAASTMTAGNTYIGGLVGYMGSGLILDSIASGSIGNATAQRVGGLVGYMAGGATVESSYSTAMVRGLSNTGGLVGYIAAGTVSNSFTTGSVYGNGGAGVVGPLVGVSLGTVTNSWVVAGTFCDSSTAGGTQACNASYYAGSAASVNVFFDPTNAPLSSWDFVTTWQSDLLSLPVLR